MAARVRRVRRSYVRIMSLIIAVGLLAAYHLDSDYIYAHFGGFEQNNEVASTNVSMHLRKLEDSIKVSPIPWEMCEMKAKLQLAVTGADTHTDTEQDEEDSSPEYSSDFTVEPKKKKEVEYDECGCYSIFREFQTYLKMPAARSKNNIFIDFGANVGQSASDFFLKHEKMKIDEVGEQLRNWTLWQFELNQKFRGPLHCKISREIGIKRCFSVFTGVWVADGELSFYKDLLKGKKYLEYVDATGSSLFNRPKRRTGKGAWVRGGCSIKGSQALLDIFEGSDLRRKKLRASSGPRVILKVDMEGAEYVVLEDLLNKGVLDFIDSLLVEWHWTIVGREEHDTLKPYLERRIALEAPHVNYEVWTY